MDQKRLMAKNAYKKYGIKDLFILTLARKNQQQFNTRNIRVKNLDNFQRSII